MGVKSRVKDLEKSLKKVHKALDEKVDHDHLDRRIGEVAKKARSAGGSKSSTKSSTKRSGGSAKTSTSSATRKAAGKKAAQTRKKKATARKRAAKKAAATRKRSARSKK